MLCSAPAPSARECLAEACERGAQHAGPRRRVNVGYPTRMVKTSVYLPEELKERLSRASRASGESEATIIRSALEQWLGAMLRPRRSAHWGTVDFGDPDLASKVDDVLAEGFGTS
jgi:hypothetical protein